MTDEKKLTELFRRLNLTSPGWQSIDTFSKIVFQIVIADPKKKKKTLYGGILTSGDIATCYADPKKANEELGWKAERGIKEMCEDSWRFTKNNTNM